MKFNIMSASEASDKTILAEKNYKALCENKAIDILDEFHFNEKVAAACNSRDWCLKDDIYVSEGDVAAAMRNLLEDAGYIIDMTKPSDAWLLRVRWSRKTMRR